MAIWNKSCVIACPAENQSAANLLACALGYDELPGNTFSVPVTVDGKTVTHYSNHSWATAEFIDDLLNAAGGTLPARDWAAFGLTEDDAKKIIAGLIVSVQDDGNPMAHIDNVLAATGLAHIDESIAFPVKGEDVTIKPDGGAILGKPIQEATAISVGEAASDPVGLTPVKGKIGVLRLTTAVDYTAEIAEAEAKAAGEIPIDIKQIEEPPIDIASIKGK